MISILQGVFDQYATFWNGRFTLLLNGIELCLLRWWLRRQPVAGLMPLLRQMIFLRRRNLACLQRAWRWPCRSAFWVNVRKASPGLIAKTVSAGVCRATRFEPAAQKSCERKSGKQSYQIHEPVKSERRCLLYPEVHTQSTSNIERAEFVRCRAWLA